MQLLLLLEMITPLSELAGGTSRLVNRLDEKVAPSTTSPLPSEVGDDKHHQQFEEHRERKDHQIPGDPSYHFSTSRKADGSKDGKPGVGLPGCTCVIESRGDINCGFWSVRAFSCSDTD